MEQTLNILVVDDDEVDRLLFQRVLRASGIQASITEVEDCAGAIAHLEASSFDCIFLDYRLPDGDGLELILQIRQLGTTLPIVVLTGQGDERIAVELMKSGASDYLVKSSLTPDNLAQTLRSVTRIYQAEAQVALTQARLRQSEERFRSLVQYSSDIITILEPDGTISYESPSIERILGYLPDELLGKRLQDFVHPADQEIVAKVLAEAIAQPRTPLYAEYRIQHAEGSWVYLDTVSNNLLANPSIQGIVINSRDISQRKRAEDSLRFLVEANTILSSSLDYATALENLVRLAVPRLADWCAIDANPPGEGLQRLAVAHFDPAKEALLWEIQQRYPASPDAEFGYPKVLRTGETDYQLTLSLESLAGEIQDADHHQLLEQINCRSYICVPLRVGDRVLGSLLFVMSDSGRLYEPEDITLFQDLAYQAALAVENAQLYQQAQEASENLRRAILVLGERQRQLQTLQRLTTLLNQRLADLPGLLQVMVDAMCDAIPGAQFGLIVLHNAQNWLLQLTATAGSGVDRFETNDSLRVGDGLLGQIFLTGESRLIIGKEHRPKLLGAEVASICAVAIESAQSGRLGVLSIGNWLNDYAFDEDDRQLLLAFGEQAAIAIDNAQLINALEEREERLAVQNDLLAQQNWELEQQRHRIQQQNIQLLEAARLKSQFLATMSHELRTPMNAIIGFSQLLLRQRQSPLSNQQTDAVERILNNGKHLLALINDILDLSKIESGRLDLEMEEFNVVNLARATMDELRSLADQKRLALNLQSDLSDPMIVNDRARLRQILVNLLSNAVKFTETGSVTVQLQSRGVDRISLSVTDTGIGISQADLKHIFEEFRQVDQSLRRRYSGTGLGLAIVDWLVRIMDGTIRVESEEKKGSCFEIELPRCVSPPPPAKVQSWAQTRQSRVIT